MSEETESILYLTTVGGENPEKASVPFVLAIAALATDIKATIALQGNSVYLIKEEYRKHMLPGGGFPHMDKLFTDFLELGGELLVCGPCIKQRNIDVSEIPEGSKIGAAGLVNILAIESDALFVF